MNYCCGGDGEGGRTKTARSEGCGSLRNEGGGANVFGLRRGARKCAPCHSIGPGAENKVGPELNGLDRRKAGTVPEFGYSDANKASSIIWNEAAFKEYIKDPSAKIPGTKMVFAGIKSNKELDDLWDYVSEFDSSGKVKPK
jgi:cytochrome c